MMNEAYLIFNRVYKQARGIQVAGGKASPAAAAGGKRKKLLKVRHTRLSAFSPVSLIPTKIQ